MTLDDRIAKAINVTMATGLVLAFCGFVLWGLVSEFGHVREIYAALAPEDQRHLDRFGMALLMLVTTLGFLPRLVRRRRDRIAAEMAS